LKGVGRASERVASRSGNETSPAKAQEAKDRLETRRLFATPIGLWHRHFNASKRLVARYPEITTIPLTKALGAWFIKSKIGEDTV
jgi:hypothetical protein